MEVLITRHPSDISKPTALAAGLEETVADDGRTRGLRPSAHIGIRELNTASISNRTTHK